MRKKSLNPKATESRRESSRNAARTRRCVEGQIFHEMLSVLPFNNGGPANNHGPMHIDKISVIRISLAYIKLRHILRYHFRNVGGNNQATSNHHALDDNCPTEGTALDRPERESGQNGDVIIASSLSGLNLDPIALMSRPALSGHVVGDALKALDCFFFVVSARGMLLYLSDNVEQHLGIPKTCMVGHKFLDFVHPCDQREVNEALTAAAASHNVTPNATTSNGQRSSRATTRPDPESEETLPLNDRPPKPRGLSCATVVIDVIVRLKSLSHVSSTEGTYGGQQSKPEVGHAYKPGSAITSTSPDTTDSYYVRENEAGCPTDLTAVTQQPNGHHQLRLNINFLQQQPNHRVMHLYGHAISKASPRRAPTPGALTLRRDQIRDQTKTTAATPGHHDSCNTADDEMSFYIFLIASPVCGSAFDKLTSRCLDKGQRPLSAGPTSRAPTPARPGATNGLKSAMPPLEKPLRGCHNFILSRHQMDMKILFFDEFVTDVLGYEIWQMIGRSYYDFIHVLDLDTFRKNVESLHLKGQIETGMYRLLVNNGGYTWVNTQASLVSYPIESSSGLRPSDTRSDKSASSHNPKCDTVKQVVCLHKIVSQKEGEDHILAELQKPDFQSHLWKGISLHTEQILFKKSPPSPTTVTGTPFTAAAAASSLKARTFHDPPSTLKAPRKSTGHQNTHPREPSRDPVLEAFSKAELYEGPVLALNLSQARALKRNHQQSQPEAQPPARSPESAPGVRKVVLDEESLATDLFRRAPCLTHEYPVKPGGGAGPEGTFDALLPTMVAASPHKRRKNLSSPDDARTTYLDHHPPNLGSGEEMSRTLKAATRGPTRCYLPNQAPPRVILPKGGAVSTRCLSHFLMEEDEDKGDRERQLLTLSRIADEDFYTRAPLAGDSCISVDSSILLSPMGIKRKEITKLVHVGNDVVLTTKPLTTKVKPDLRILQLPSILTVKELSQVRHVPPTFPTPAVSEMTQLTKGDRTDSMENILEDIMSLQEDKGITFDSEVGGAATWTDGCGKTNDEEGEVEVIKRALLDDDSKTGLMLTRQKDPIFPNGIFAHCAKPLKLTPNGTSPILPYNITSGMAIPKMANPEILLTSSAQMPNNAHPDDKAIAMQPTSRVTAPRINTAYNLTSRAPSLTLTYSHDVYHNILKSWNCTIPTILTESVAGHQKRRIDSKSVPTRLANGVLANLLKNGEDLSFGYKCLPSIAASATVATKHEAEDVLPNGVKYLSSARRNSEPVTTAEYLLKSVIGGGGFTKPDSKFPKQLNNNGSVGHIANGLTIKVEPGALDPEPSECQKGYGNTYHKGGLAATFGPGAAGKKLVYPELFPHPKSSPLGHEGDYLSCGPPSDHDYTNDFMQDYAGGQAILGDSSGDCGDVDRWGATPSLTDDNSNDLLKGLYATTVLLPKGNNDYMDLSLRLYNNHDELYSLNTHGMNVFEETNILDDV